MTASAVVAGGIGVATGSTVPARNCCALGGGVNGSALDCDSSRGERPRKVRLFCVPTHIGARSSSVMSGMRMMCGVIVSTGRCGAAWSVFA